jgi:hypothetical protein
MGFLFFRSNLCTNISSNIISFHPLAGIVARFVRFSMLLVRIGLELLHCTSCRGCWGHHKGRTADMQKMNLYFPDHKMQQFLAPSQKVILPFRLPDSGNLHRPYQW